MYEYIEGIYKGLSRDCVVVDNHGIGYRIFTSGNSICSLPPLNEVVKLYIEQIVREDFIGLYGFINIGELEMFVKLIGINGVGPKAALSLLSYNTVDRLKSAIYNSDEVQISKASGIGKKTAQRIILEMKDKIELTGVECVEEETSADFDFKAMEVTQALLSLGFDQKSTDNVVKSVMKNFSNQSSEFIIKECLKNLMR